MYYLKLYFAKKSICRKQELQIYHNRIMDATNDNKLETYAPFETVNPFIYNLVYNQQIIDLTLKFAQFLERHENFKVNQFSVPLIFWISLNELKKEEWFTLTEEIIDLIGYKSSESNNNWKS